MIKKSVQDALNDQITKEFYSSYLYLSMSAYFHSLNLNGFAQWMRIQAEEENAHAMKFFDYLVDRGGEVKLGALEAPPDKWNSPLEAFEAALEHERYITDSVNKLAELAIREKDFATNNLAQFFVDEQVEEESSVEDIVQRMKFIEDFKPGLIMLDAELAQRKPTSSEPTK